MKLTFPELDRTTLIVVLFVAFIAGAFVAKMVGPDKHRV